MAGATEPGDYRALEAEEERGRGEAERPVSPLPAGFRPASPIGGGVATGFARADFGATALPEVLLEAGTEVVQGWPLAVWQSLIAQGQPLLWQEAQHSASALCRELHVPYGRDSRDRVVCFESVMIETYGPSWKSLASAGARARKAAAQAQLELEVIQTRARLGLIPEEGDAFPLDVRPPTQTRLSAEALAGVDADFATSRPSAAEPCTPTRCCRWRSCQCSISSQSWSEYACRAGRSRDRRASKQSTPE